MRQEASERLLTLLQRLLEIESTEVSEVVSQAALLIAQALTAEKTDIFLYDEKIRTLVALGVSETPLGRLEQSLGMDRLPIVNGGRAVSVFQSGISYRSGQVDQDAEELPGVKWGMSIRSVIAVPLVIGGERRGVIQVDSTRPDSFSEQDQHFLEGVAHWIGIVVHRAELLQQVAQEAVEEARRMTAQELMTILAHDLHNYLTPVHGRLDLLERRATREQRELDLRDVAAIGTSLRRFERLISDLMDMARLSQGFFDLTLQVVDLAVFIEETVAALQTPSIQIVVEVPDGLQIWADADRLRQAIENVLANAVKHAPARTAVLIQAERREGSGDILLSISDQGPGIPREVLPHLFEPFRKESSSHGLGLGLYLAQQIAMAHGGTLAIDPTLQSGTRLVFCFPARNVPAN